MYDFDEIKNADPEIAEVITAEMKRQNSHIELIASENWVSKAVMAAMGSPLTNKYAEGYPGKRYYGGCQCVDVAEELARERAKKLFGCEYVNVQPHSGAQANMAVQFAMLTPGDTIMGMNLDHGGHLTHGSPVNLSGKYFHVVPYGVNDDGVIDYDKVLEIAKECKPKMIIAGASAYARTIDFKRFREIADEVGSYLMVDMAHIAGLVAAGLHPSPIPYAHVTTTTTHKTEEKALCNIRKNIGCLIEYPCFVPGMTVEQTLHYYAIQKGVPDNKKIGEAIQLTGLSEKQHAKCKTLSLGQKQRLGLAVALLGEPQILILDEPINGLDPSGIVEFRSILQQLNEQKNITILLSSHILSELQHLATVYGFLNKGILLEEISSEALHAKCANCIELTVSDAEKYTVLLEKIFPEENYKVLPGNTIRIYKPHETAESFSRLAAKNDVYITKMQTLQTSLEDYYMELKKRGAVKC